jgi:ABC-type branched-subunit amino acid transport system ATPase component
MMPDEPAVAAIEVEHLSRRYGELVAVDDLTLRIGRRRSRLVR